MCLIVRSCWKNTATNSLRRISLENTGTQSPTYRQTDSVFPFYLMGPGWAARANIRLDIHLDIRLDIRKITGVRVELSVQPRISMAHFTLWYS